MTTCEKPIWASKVCQTVPALTLLRAADVRLGVDRNDVMCYDMARDGRCDLPYVSSVGLNWHADLTAVGNGV